MPTTECIQQQIPEFLTVHPTTDLTSVLTMRPPQNPPLTPSENPTASTSSDITSDPTVEQTEHSRTFGPTADPTMHPKLDPTVDSTAVPSKNRTLRGFSTANSLFAARCGNHIHARLPSNHRPAETADYPITIEQRWRMQSQQTQDLVSWNGSAPATRLSAACINITHARTYTACHQRRNSLT